MATYATKVKRDIERWVAAGLINSDVALALSKDIDEKHHGISFVTVLSIMASALFSAAVLIMVAANWEEIPRVTRVAVLFGLILAGYVGGAFLKLREQDSLAESVWVLAATAFGASIALIAQMYHMSGDEKQAVLVWCLGTGLAAGALRSSYLTAGAAILAIAWMLMWAFDDWRFDNLPMEYFLLALILYVLSMWTLSGATRRIILLSLCVATLLYYVRDENLNAPLLLCAFYIGLYISHRQFREETSRYLGLGNDVPILSLIGILSGLGIMQLVFFEDPEFLFVTICAFAAIITILMLSGRESASLRWLAYAGFIFQLCFTYLVMMGTMLDTAAFFVFAGISLSVLAFIISRLERRFSANKTDAVSGGAI